MEIAANGSGVLSYTAITYISIMIKTLFAAWLLLPVIVSGQQLFPGEIQRCEATAKRTTIIRDNWGVPHIYGKTDADAVFGLMYTQCEDNFKGIERNYLYQLGRQAEVDGESPCTRIYNCN